MAADVIAIIFRTYISENSIEHLAAALKKGGINDLLLFFPQNKREDKVLDEFFRKRGLGSVADWWTKKKYAILKEEVIKTLKEHQQNDDSAGDVRRYLFFGLTLLFGIDRLFFSLVRLWLLFRRGRKNSICRTRNSYSAFGRV